VPVPTITVTPPTVPAGQDVVVSGSGFPAGAPIDILLFSTPSLLGSTVTDATGRFRVTVTVPVDTPPGSHRVVAAVRGGTIRAEAPLTVLGPTAPLAAAPAGRLSRTGSGVAPPVGLAATLVVVGLLLVGGGEGGPIRRRGTRTGGIFQHPPTG
jgi:hypothetical protein